MTRTLRSSSKASTGSQLVKASRPDVVVFPDGSVVWEEPEVVEPLPYAGYELPPLKARRTSVVLRSQANLTLKVGGRTRWMAVGGAIALLTVGIGVTLTHLAQVSTAGSREPHNSPLGPVEMQRYSANPSGAVLPGL